MKSNQTIVLIDDNPVFLRHAQRFLSQQPGFAVVAVAKTGQEGLRSVQAVRPDVVLLDISLPDQSGLDLIPAVKEAAPESGVIVVTMQDAAQYRDNALRRGADGFVAKAHMAEDLVREIQRVTAS